MRQMLLAIAVILTATPATAANFGDAVAHYSLQEYDKAYAEWSVLAAEGDIPSAYYLGMLHEMGRGTPLNIQAAVDWYRKAADAGHADASYRLCLLARQADTLPANFDTILGWLTQAAEGGIADAQYELAALLAEGKRLPRDLAAARDWFAKAELGFGDATKRHMAGQMKDLVEARLGD